MNEEIMRRAVTPAYIFDLDKLEERIRMLRSCFGGSIRIVYAMKANPFLVGVLLPFVDGLEVCSPGEARICQKAGVPAEKMVLSGVNKEEADVREYVRRWGSDAVYTAESELQVERLNREALEQGCTLKVLLRLGSGNQFGMDEAAVRKLLRTCSSYRGLEFCGIQYFSGTQKRLKRILEELEELDALCESLASKGSPQRQLEYGPGLPASYFTGDKGMAEEELLAAFAEKLRGMHFRGQITLEIGRFLTAYCGYYLTSVRDLKKIKDSAYCIVDGGIHQMNYYGQMMGMKRPHMRLLPAAGGEKVIPADNADDAQKETTHWTVCGSLCTTADVLLRDLPLEKLELFDTLVFERCGAYSMTEGISLFLSRDLPRIYFARKGELKDIRQQILTEEWNYGRIDQTP